MEDLDLQGDHMRYIPMREMGIMRSLRKVAIASTRDYGNLRPSQFEDFPPGLEVLNLIDSNIKVVRSNAFYHIPSVSRLDLSGNKIVRIEDVAFREIGKSLLHLKMTHALHIHELPNKPFRSLTALLTLDLSDNHIRVVPLDTFHHMNRLEKLFLQVCTRSKPCFTDNCQRYCCRTMKLMLFTLAPSIVRPTPSCKFWIYLSIASGK